MRDVAAYVTRWGYQVHTSLFVQSHTLISLSRHKNPKSLHGFRAFSVSGLNTMETNLWSQGVSVLLQDEGTNCRQSMECRSVQLQMSYAVKQCQGGSLKIHDNQFKCIWRSSFNGG